MTVDPLYFDIRNEFLMQRDHRDSSLVLAQGYPLQVVKKMALTDRNVHAKFVFKVDVKS